MPTFQTILQDKDLSFLQNIAFFWGIELSAPDDISAKTILLESISKDHNQVLEIVDSLPEDAKKAFLALLENDGRMVWTKFARSYGDVRNMGSAKRERERPDLNPNSPAEKLWYRGLIGRAFLRIKEEPQEFVFIPDEFLFLVKPNTSNKLYVTINSISSSLIEPKKNVNDNLLHDACTLLAGLRKGMSESEIQPFLLEIPYFFVFSLLKTANIINSEDQLDTEATRLFLETPRNESMLNLFNQWLNSNEINEMMLIPELIIENKLDNNAKQTRIYILEKIFELTALNWWKQNSFISKIKQENPDFLRPSGNFDTWFIKKVESNGYLLGFEHWDQVEGKLIRFLLNGPLQWFGIIDTGESKEDKSQTCRISKSGKDIWQKKYPHLINQIEEKPKIDSFGKIVISKNVPLALRYQISRFCDWEIPNHNEFRYQLTPKSLIRAEKHGLNPNQFLTLIQKAIGQIPPTIRSVFENWEKNRLENFIKKETLLRVSNPEIIVQLKESNTSKFIKEILSPTVAIINDGSENKIQKAIFELGFFTDWIIDEVE
jgi:hypothetical protein